MSSIELKPCPFCGGEVAMYDKFDDDIHKYFKIACGYCHLSMSSYTYRVYSEEDRESTKTYLILAWNRRAYNKPIRQSCKSCKHYTPDPNYRDGDMGNCRYLEKIWDKPFYVNEARAECEHFQAAERRNENGNET